MNIAICDDERIETEHLRSLIEAFALQQDYDIHCKTFTAGTALLEEDRFDLYFLDYRMEEMSGVDLAAALREKFQNAVTICFLTNYEAAAQEVINRQIYADGFLKKPVDPVLLYAKLSQFYSASFGTRFELKKGKGFRTIYAQEILFVEADGKRSKLHLKDREESFNYLISDLEKNVLVGSMFFRIHRSYIVNLQYVASYDSKTVTMADGTVLPLKARTFRDVYRNYLFRMNH